MSMTKQLEGLCPHDRLTTAYCPDCAIEGELYQHKQIDWKVWEVTAEESAELDAALSDGGSSDYYDLPEGATRIQDVIRDMTWNQANIFKAAYRWDLKPDLMYNLRKILWFVEDEIEHQTQLSKKPASIAKKKD